MIDTKVSRRAFVNRKYVKFYKFFIVRLQKLIKLRLTNDKLILNIIHITQLTFSLNDHIDTCWCLITNLSKYDIIINMFWLQKHDSQINFVLRSLTFNFDYCIIHCLFNQCSIIIYSDDMLKKHHNSLNKLKEHDDICEIFAYVFNRMINRKNYDLIVMWSKHFEMLN